MRLLWLFLLLAALVLIPFAIWGEGLTALFEQEAMIGYLNQWGIWGWLLGILLLMGDLLLPLPGTIIMSAMGYVYGIAVGGIVSAIGSFLSGALAYELCHRMGRKMAVRLLGEKDLARGESLFASVGGWVVALSRWLPVFPEVVACMAGLTRMPRNAYYLALACGSIPLGFTYAAVGQLGWQTPWLAILLSAGLPPILWLSIRSLFLRHQDHAAREESAG